MKRRVLVVVAHADDEALGCGGTIARHVAEGDSVAVLSMTDGVGARGADEAAARSRREAAERSAEALGFTWVAAGDFPDNALDTVPLLDVARFVEQAKREASPSLVYTHHHGDLNVDHRVACQAVLTACRPQPGEEVREIRTFEVASSTEWGVPVAGLQFTPNLSVGIEPYWALKQASLEAYADEMRDPPHARSIEGLRQLAAVRGRQAGLPLAEAFMLIRRVVA
jgi:LmbE family N-acetylglucosaminyl deacetylase